MIAISRIIISKEEENAVLEVLRSGNLVQGKKVEEFEKNFAKYIGTKYAIAVANGSIALHLAMLALNLKEGDTVITTPFSFIASTNAIFYVKAKPVFVDITNDYNIDASKIEEKITPKTRAILLVHLFGNPCDMDTIFKIARKYKLVVIEDAAQANGAEYKGKRIGSFGMVGCFSFYATKNMTTGGEGGMLTTNDDTMYKYLKMVRSHGSTIKYYHEFLGYNFRMTEMQAALGRLQLKKLDAMNRKRIANAVFYNKKLQNIPGIVIPRMSTSKKHVFHHYTLRITKEVPLTRDTFLKFLEKKGVGCSVHYPLPIHKQEEIIKMGYKHRLPVAEQISHEVISIPVHPYLTVRELTYITSTILRAAKQ